MIGKARSVNYLMEVQKSLLPWLTFTIWVCSKKCVQCGRKFRKCNVIFYLRITCQIRCRIVYLVIRVTYIIASRLIWPYSILHNEGSRPDLHNKRRNDILMTSYWAGQDLMPQSHSKVLILTSAMLALAASDSCSDCTAVVSHIAGRLSTPESLAAQGVPFLSTSPLKIHFWLFFWSPTTKQSNYGQNCLQEILVGELCPGAPDPEACVSGLPGLWNQIAALLWPGYWDPTVSYLLKLNL